MIKFAITGNIAAGKTEIEKFLKQKGYKVFDTDIIAHNLLNENKEELVKLFQGFDILTANKIDRKKIANIVFNDNSILKILENFIHPKVKSEIEKIFLENQNEEFIFVSVPQLFEAKFEKLFDKIVLIDTDENIRLQRLMKRNSLTEEAAQKRIKSQMTTEQKKEFSDFVIENNKEIIDFHKNIEQFLFDITQIQTF